MTHMNLNIKLNLHYKTAVYSRSVQYGFFFTVKSSELKRFSVYKAEINLLVQFKISRSEKILMETLSPLSIIQEINLLEEELLHYQTEMQYWSTPKPQRELVIMLTADSIMIKYPK